MKKLALATIVASSLLAGCGGSDGIPSECIEVVELTAEIAKITEKPSVDEADAIKKLESQWETMSDEKKEKTKAQCVQAKSMMEMLKKEAAG